MCEGSETDPEARIAELHKRRDEIDAEIGRVLAGDIPLLDDTALKDRFQQFSQLARELLGDFREVEQKFRQLDRSVRERIALWEGGKGALLEEIMGERDLIADTDQGRSFRAFWDFLMSSRRQEELTQLLDRVLSLPPVTELKPDSRTRRLHYDWLEAGEHTQRTVAQLSMQLRRFLDDQSWLENRRIMEILHGVEARALAVRETPPVGDFVGIAQFGADVELPMERPLYTPAIKPAIIDSVIEAGDIELDARALYSQVIVDTPRLLGNVRHALSGLSQITLGALCDREPLRYGLAELIAYLHLHGDDFKTVIDDTTSETIRWQITGDGGEIHSRQASLPRVIFVR